MNAAYYPEPPPSQAAAVAQARSQRRSLALLGPNGWDAWVTWFSQQEHAFAPLWCEAFTDAQDHMRAISLHADAGLKGSDPDAIEPHVQHGRSERAEQLSLVAPDAFEYFMREQADALEAATKAVARVDGKHLLALLFFSGHVSPWGTGAEVTDDADDLDLEIAGQIIASQPWSSGQGFTPKNVIDALGSIRNLRLIALAVNTVGDYLAESEAVVARSGADSDVAALTNRPTFGPRHVSDARVRSNLLLRRLVMRGAAYKTHAHRLSLALAKNYESALLQKWGFTIRDLVAVADAFTQLTREHVNDAIVDAATLDPDLLVPAPPGINAERWEAYLRQMSFVIGAGIYLTPVLAPAISRLETYLEQPTLGRLPKLIEHVAQRAGAGKALSSVLADPVARRRPFMLFDEFSEPGQPPSFAACIAITGPYALQTDMVTTIDLLLAEARGNTWPSAKADALDSYSVQLLASKLPGCQAFTSVFIAPEDGDPFEIDGVILLDDTAIVMEGKAAPAKGPARRGDVPRYRSELVELVGVGVKQLRRDAAIFDNGSVQLRDQSGHLLATVPADSITRVFSVMPLLDDLMAIGTKLDLLTQWGILKPDEVPWIVSVTDMNIVVDAVRGPGELFAYLGWRQIWARHEKITFIDEIECFAPFQRAVDLDAKMRAAEHVDMVLFDSGQAPFDDYYAGLEGTGPVCAQPRLMLTPRFERFGQELDQERPAGWIGASIAALQVPGTVQTAMETGSICRDLAEEATAQGFLLAGDDEYRFVIAGPGAQWEDVCSTAVIAQLNRAGTTLYLRARRSQLRLTWAAHAGDNQAPPASRETGRTQSARRTRRT